MRALVSAGLFLVSLATWRWALRADLGTGAALGLAVGGAIAIVPVSWGGRRALERHPAPQRACWVTVFVHFLVMLPLGAAIFAGFSFFARHPGPALPIPRQVAFPLLIVTVVAAALTVANLALEGLGAPFAVVTSRRLATRYFYRWTRNPMLLATLALLVAYSVWLASAACLAWILAVVSPAWVAFVRIYEERELEIRFGEGYRAYHLRTPFLWPGRPRP
jgi:protein-S-isoprenylcysteine O-methyltransferase Ste14